jgi:transcriptional regulator GlxA family with amidase domain
LNFVRIQEARRLLTQTDLKLAQVAERVGFGNLTHFGRQFKRQTNFTPLQYKKLNKASKTLT